MTEMIKINLNDLSAEGKCQIPFDPEAALEKYNFVRNKMAKAPIDSLPIGNGDVTANVWVEENGNLLFYIGKNDAWAESTRLLKVGKVRISLCPNPFMSGASFSQKLDYLNGEIIINVKDGEKEISVRVWTDSNAPVIRTEINSNVDLNVKASAEIWRTGEKNWTSEEMSSYRGLSDGGTGSPLDLKESPDIVVSGNSDRVVWYHRNEHSVYDVMLKTEHVENAVTAKDPYLNRTFGACLIGNGFTVDSDEKEIVSKTNGKSFLVAAYVYTSQTETADLWVKELEEIICKTEKTDIESARKLHRKYWKEFWNKSYIFVNGDSDAERVTACYISQRYMQAIQSRGKYAMKFNGGTINVDYFTDWPVDKANVNADYRRWGPCYWSQNTRLLYWNMLTSGDFDLMLPLFDMYCGLLQTQKEMTSAYYGHGGAFFPETLYFHGLYSVEDFGWNNDGVEANSVFIHHYWSGGLEIATMMLDYYEYTKDSKIFTEKLLPFITEAIRFFDQHYGRDENGTIIISPINILETYQKSYENINSTDVLAPLHRMLPRLLKLDVDAKLLNEWSALYNSLPAIPESNDENGINLIKPAYAYNKFRGNGENPELYTLFPYRLYGIGVPETFKTALDSFKYRITPNCACWGQDGIHAAYVGLSDEAKTNLIKQFSRTVEDEGAYIGYWKQGDWVPDLDNGGAAATALQSMLIQCYDEKTACIFPAWPKEWNVDFKLYAPNNKIVAGNCTDGNCVVYNLV